MNEAHDCHEATCVSLYMRYERLVVLQQPLDGSSMVKYKALLWPTTLWTEDEVRSMRGSESFFLTSLQIDILGEQLLPLLHRVGLDRQVPDHGSFFPVRDA